MNIVQNNNTVPYTPSGCDGGVGNITTTANADMTVNGVAGSSAVSGSGVATSSKTGIYFVGNSGDYNGSLTINAGTWTVPVYLNTATGGIVVTSVFIYRVNSSGVAQATIGSSTGLSTTLTAGSATSFSVTGASATFSTGDAVVVSVQIKSSFPGTSFTIIPSQTITTPSSSSGGTSYSVPSAVFRLRGGLPTLTNGSSGSVSYSVPSAIFRLRGGVTTLTTDAGYPAPSANLRFRGGVTALGTGGSLSYSVPSAIFRFRGAPVSAPTPLTSPLRFRRGPSPQYPLPGWPEGAPYEAGIITNATTGSTFEMLFLGGHDGLNKLVGGGFQVYSGNGPPSWTPTTDGTWTPTVLTSGDLKLWFYVAGNWHYLLLT